jgi:hypothetical protein
MKADFDLKDYETGLARFDSLMTHKIKDILLVSSLYDSYILKEDGQVTELVMSEYAEFNLSHAPSVKRVSTGEEALELLEKRSFDLIIIFRGLGNIDAATFSRKAKKIIPEIPIILLAFHPRELELLRQRKDFDAVDKAFVWSGQVNIFLAIIKYIEDIQNVEYDTDLVSVRVIIIVEDSVRFYSSYLPLIYSEIMTQTQALMSDGINMTHRMLRMRARPKILLVDNYEDAAQLFKRYKKCLLGIISDVSFDRGGKRDDKAGIRLIGVAKKDIDDLPVLLQSSDPKNADLALKHHAAFLNKSSPKLLYDLRNFIKQNFGFGDFVFRMPDGTEICHANNFRSMEKSLARVPKESVLYHASRNHFSNWLMARTEFDLAIRLRPRKVSEFKNTHEIRKYLISTFKIHRREKQLGFVTDFERGQFDSQTEFVRIGGGSLGGKGRGLAFVNNLLRRYDVYDKFENVQISVPPTAIIGTEVYDNFIEKNNLLEYALEGHSDKDIVELFARAELPRSLIRDLRSYMNVIDYPLAVRSSSLLEDSHYQPFAGIFDTHMLPNNFHAKKGRLLRLVTAIKLIYASIFFNNARNYIEATGNRVEEEKMAVILQKIVGSNRGGNFFPVLSGVARSYNFYSIGNIKPEEGIAYTALGLGKTIVEGENCLFFSPSNPRVLPQFSSSKDYLDNSQKDFFAVDMTDPAVFPGPGGEMGLVRLPLSVAESDGSLSFVGSTYSADNDRIYSGINRQGIKLVTFDPILKAGLFPLDEITKFLLQLGANAMNSPIEMEFAAELYLSAKKKKNQFYFLQIRPMTNDTPPEAVSIRNLDQSRIFCRSDKSLSNGRIDNIRDIVFVRPDNFDRAKMPEMAGQIEKFNDEFQSEKRPYLLIGPGRWGTADRWLGIPVKWKQISSARVMVEAVYGDFVVTPSFGTHFFQNVMSFNIGYLTVGSTKRTGFLDWEWLELLPPAGQTEFVRHVHLEKPLEILIDGRKSKAVILKPK